MCHVQQYVFAVFFKFLLNTLKKRAKGLRLTSLC